MSKGLIGFLWHETLKPLRQISQSVVVETEKNISQKHHILDIFTCLCINVNQYKQYTEYIHTTGYLHHTRISNCYHLKSAWYFLAGKLSVQWFIFKSDFALGGNIKTMYES